MSGPIVTASAVTKRYPGVVALDGVDFELEPGEVHVLAGENGAGKSTLIKVLAGVTTPDSGTVTVDGRERTDFSPSAALEDGIATVFQEFNLVPELSVADNVLLGRTPSRAGFVRRAERRRRAAELIDDLRLDLGPAEPVGRLGVAQRQMVEILRALAVDGFRVLLMDEPTAVLSRQETETLFEVMGQLRRRDIAIVYISHRMEEIERMGDRVTIFRDGRRVSCDPASEVGPDEIVRRMVGREVSMLFPERAAAPQEQALGVRGVTLASGRARGVDLEVRRGEVVGLFGLVGAGRTELLRAVLGLEDVVASEIAVHGAVRSFSGPGEAAAAGVGLAPEERRKEGLVPEMSVGQNIALGSLGRHRRGPFLSPARLRRAADEAIAQLRIAVPSPETPIASLSGGNQQKCILARLLAAEIDVLLLDEPTRGIDVGARAEVYRLVRSLADSGKAVLMASSDLVEVIGLSDRVVVMRSGRIAGELPGADATEEAVMRLAVPESIAA